MPLKPVANNEADEFPFAKKTIKMAGKEYTFRELSVQENDEAADMSRDKDGKINGRTMMRLMIVSSAVEPRLSVDDLAKMPQRFYVKIYEVVNELNNLVLDEDDDEGNG